jgi:hypothetical protein
MVLGSTLVPLSPSDVHLRGSFGSTPRSPANLTWYSFEIEASMKRRHATPPIGWLRYETGFMSVEPGVAERYGGRGVIRHSHCRIRTNHA